MAHILEFPIRDISALTREDFTPQEAARFLKAQLAHFLNHYHSGRLSIAHGEAVELIGRTQVLIGELESHGATIH